MAVVAPVATAAQTLYILPDNPRQIILSLEIGSDLQAPNLQITVTAHGDVDYVNSGQHQKSPSLDPKQLQQLLALVIGERHFLQLSAPKIRQQIAALEQQGRWFVVADGVSSRIQVNLPGQQQRVEFYALAVAGQLFPEIGPLQDLLAIQKRLLALAGL